ncbi:hypothetical protein [Acidiferrobacter sp.]
MADPRDRWAVRRTLLIVGEGHDEERFLRHVKALYVSRGCGLMVTVGNARGKGARHVIDWTARQAANQRYDKIAALLDTDTDWSPAVAATARKKKIVVLKSEPCLEALLLRILGHVPVGDAESLKRQWRAIIGDPADIKRHAALFTTPVLEASRGREPAIDGLLGLLRSAARS